MNKWLFPSLLLFFSLALQGKSKDSYEEKINTLIDAHNYAEALKVLELWKSNKGEADPQYWVAGGNIWFGLAVKPTMEVTDLPNGSYEAKASDDTNIIIVDPKTGNQVGEILQGKPAVDRQDMMKAISFLDEGIRRNSQRLDIFIGRAHLYRVLEDLKGELTSLESFISDPKPRNGKFETAPGQFLKGNLAEFQLDMLMAYAREHLKKQDKANDEAAKGIAELIIQAFPKRPHGYNLLGALATYDDNWLEAKKWLQLALEQDSADSLVLANLGRCYEMLGDTASARQQYEKIIGLNNDPKIVESTKAKLATLDRK